MRFSSFTARTVVVALVPALAAFATACGKSEEEKARENVDAWLQAVVDGDAKRYCELLAERSKRPFERQGGCEKVAKQVFDSPAGRFTSGVANVLAKAEKKDVTVDGDTGRARIVFESGGQTRDVTLELRKEDGKWRVLSAPAATTNTGGSTGSNSGSSSTTGPGTAGTATTGTTGTGTTR